MPLTVQCSNCRKAVGVPDNATGKQVRCPHCLQPFAVSAPAPGVQATPPPPQPKAVSPPPSPPPQQRPFWYVGGSPIPALALAAVFGSCLVLTLAVWAVWGLLAMLSGPGGNTVQPGQEGRLDQAKDGQQVLPIKPLPDEKPIVITCEEMCTQYHVNSVDARNRFKGKLLEITGTVEAVVEDGARTYVHLKGKPPGRDDFFVDRVYAYFPNPQHMAGLRKGDRVTFVGRGGDWNTSGRLAEIHGCRPVPKE